MSRMDEMLSAEWRAREAARLEVARLQPSTAGGLQRALGRAAAICCETLHVDRAGIWLLDDEAHTLRCISLRDRGAAIEPPPPALRIADLGAYRRALDERRAIAAYDVEQEPLTAPLAANYFLPSGIRSTLDAPIYRDGAVIGVVCHEHRGGSRRWRDEEADFAISMGEMIGALLASDALHVASEALEQAERRLAEALETDTVAGFARGIAHDLANLLVVLLGATDRIEAKADSPREVRAACAELNAAIASATRLVKQLQLWSRDGDAGQVEALAIDAALSAMGATLRALATADRHLVLDLSAPACRAAIGATALEQAIMNLVVNAREATRSGGLIGVSTRPAARDGRPGVQIEVVDDGLGMDEQTTRRAFHPFFTTKDDGAHRGNGLASVKSLIDAANGAIELRSAPGEGSRFRIWLPLAPDA